MTVTPSFGKPEYIGPPRPGGVGMWHIRCIGCDFYAFCNDNNVHGWGFSDDDIIEATALGAITRRHLEANHLWPERVTT